MPGILNSEKRILSNYAAQSAVYIQVISKYRGPGIPTPETAICAEQVADNIKGYVFQTKETLTNSYGTLDFQTSK